MKLDNIRVVLARPKGAANVGAVARAMKNMGLRDLALVEPAPMDPAWARAMAAHAGDVLERARQFDSLAASVADCALVIGTTARAGTYRNYPWTPKRAAGEIVRIAATDKVAVLFGPEDHGLSNDDLRVCHQVVSIPSSSVYGSLNLAQAVMVCAYEIFLAAGEAQGWTWDGDRPRLASAGDLGFMLSQLQKAFLSIGFLSRDNPDHIMHAFRTMFGRAQLEEREVRILLGLARQIEWCARQYSNYHGHPAAEGATRASLPEPSLGGEADSSSE